MKRNPLWDAQAQQLLKSGVLQNSLAQQATPGVGMKKPMPAVPMSMINRPVEQPQQAPGLVAPYEDPRTKKARQAAYLAKQRQLQQQSQQPPQAVPLTPQPMPGPPAPMQQTTGSIGGGGATEIGDFGQPLPAPGQPTMKAPYDPNQPLPQQRTGTIGGGPGVRRRPQPVSGTMPVANQGTPFQYRVSRGVR